MSLGYSLLRYKTHYLVVYNISCILVCKSASNHLYPCIQVFGRLLSTQPEEDRDESDSPEASDGDKEGKEDEVREHVVDILFSKGKISSLQKQVSVIGDTCICRGVATIVSWLPRTPPPRSLLRKMGRAPMIESSSPAHLF